MKPLNRYQPEKLRAFYGDQELVQNGVGGVYSASSQTKSRAQVITNDSLNHNAVSSHPNPPKQPKPNRHQRRRLAALTKKMKVRK